MSADSLLDRIRAARVEALRNRDTVMTSVLGGLVAAALQRGKDARHGSVPTPRDPTQDDTIAAVRDYLIKTEETAAGFRALGRTVEAETAEAQAKVLRSFLPVAPDEETVDGTIEDILSGLPDRTMRRMKEVMSGLAERFGSSLDKGIASKRAKAKLGN